MIRLLFVALFCCFAGRLAGADGFAFRQSEFVKDVSGWSAWCDRPETATHTFVEPVVSLGGPGSLAISGNGNIGSYGGWQRVFPGVESGQWYRLTAHYRTAGVAAESENWQVLARLDWRRPDSSRAGEVDYAYNATRLGDWTKLTLDAKAPEGASQVALQLYLAHAPVGTVWWDDIRLERVPPPAPRTVTVASINHRPSQTATSEESVRQFIDVIERETPAKVDLIVLPEGITVVGTGKRYAQVAEPVPGPTTSVLGEAARKRNAYLVAGIYEREGAAVYNTAVLIDRQGRLTGKYRKVYLPQYELEQLTPGNDYLVFDTDFGRVGIMICYDVFFSDPARALAARGAEIIVLPIWGGDQTLAKARAIENRIFLVASGYDHPTYVMSPDGVRLAEASKRGTAAVATIDLNCLIEDRKPSLGNRRNRNPRELRLDVPAGR